MKKWQFLLISLIVIGLDQLTKYLIMTHLNPYESVSILPFFSFVLLFNTGSAFSFLNDAGSWHLWFFVVLSCLMSIVILVWFFKTPAHNIVQLVSLSLILGGAVGNLLDRMCRGHVIDFLDLYYNNYHWPAFNIADSAICIGAIMLLVCSRGSKSEDINCSP